MSLFATRALAHHAEAMFDRSALLSSSGTVKEFLWANPHTLIYLAVSDASGAPHVVVFECGSASVMKRDGWSRDTIKVGEKLTVSYYPRRDLKPGGMLATATFADGTKLGWRTMGTP